MKKAAKKILLLTMSLYAIALFLVVVLLYSFQEKKMTIRQLPHYRVAIVSYSGGKQAAEMVEGYTATLQKCTHATFEHKWYSGRQDKILLRNMIQEIQSSNKYDLVLCIGIAATYTLIEIAQRKKPTIPVVFTAVSSRMWKEWSTKHTNLKKMITGTMGEYDWQTRSKLLTLLRPDVSHVIVPYTLPSDGNTETIDAIQKVLSKENIATTPIPLSQSSSVLQQLVPFLLEADALLLLRDGVALNSSQQIIKHCNQQGVTILAADFESAQAGAAASLCITEQEMGVYPAQQSIDILVHKKEIAKIPLIDVGDNGSRFVLNSSALTSQGVNLSDELLVLIKNSSVVHNYKDAS